MRAAKRSPSPASPFLQATNLEKDIKQFFLENGQVDWAGLPSTKTIPEIMARLRSSVRPPIPSFL